MTELHALVLGEMDRAGTPSYSFDDLERRRQRRRRVQRATAGVTGAVIALAVGGLLYGSIVSGPPVGPGNDHPGPRALSDYERADVLDGGRYILELGEVRITFSVPSGWTAWELGVVAPEGGWPPAGRSVGFWFVDSVYSNPCRWGGTGVRVGPSVGDLVSALSDRADRHPSSPTAVSLGGYSGTGMQIEVPSHVEILECRRGEYRSWWTDGPPETGPRYHAGAGQIDRLWILDVEGHRLVVDASFYRDTSASALDELLRIVRSARIEA